MGQAGKQRFKSSRNQERGLGRQAGRQADSNSMRIQEAFKSSGGDDVS